VHGAGLGLLGRRHRYCNVGYIPISLEDIMDTPLRHLFVPSLCGVIVGEGNC
jgi:hypothetical protein